MADTKKDAFDELGLESGAFEALERDFQQVPCNASAKCTLAACFVSPPLLPLSNRFQLLTIF